MSGQSYKGQYKGELKITVTKGSYKGEVQKTITRKSYKIVTREKK